MMHYFACRYKVVLVVKVHHQTHIYRVVYQANMLFRHKLCGIDLSEGIFKVTMPLTYAMETYNIRGYPEQFELNFSNFEPSQDPMHILFEPFLGLPHNRTLKFGHQYIMYSCLFSEIGPESP